MKRSELLFKRIIACCIITAVFMTALFTAGVFAAESKQMTEQIFFEKLEAFKSDVYADGSRYKNNEGLYMGIQCYGFANQIAKYFYGSWPTYDSRGLRANPDWTVSYGSEALQSLHIGDVVRYRSSAGADHSIFVTGFDDEKIYFSDANNDHGNTVRHNAEMTWEKLIGKMDKRLENDSSCIGWVAHYKYWDSDPDHAGIGVTLTFNANGGYIEGEKIADRYVVLDTLNLRSGPGTDNERIAKMYDDTFFDVLCGAETVEADGYTWTTVTQGENSGWAVINVEEWCAIAGPVMSSEYCVAEDEAICKTSDFSVLTVTVDTDAKLPDYNMLGLMRDGKQLIGWSDSPDGDSVTVQSLLEEAHGHELVLYAVYEEDDSGFDTAVGFDSDEVNVFDYTDPDSDTETLIIIGDVTGDGQVDNKDVVMLFKILSKGGYADPAVCDMNGDGQADNKDLIYLFRIISGSNKHKPHVVITEEESDPLTEEEPLTEVS